MRFGSTFVYARAYVCFVSLVHICVCILLITFWLISPLDIHNSPFH